MNKLKKLAGKATLAAAAVASAISIVNADTGSGSNCPTCSGSDVPCCIYYSNGNPLVLTCCRPGEKCQVKDVRGKVVAGPYDASVTYGKAGCM